MGLQTIAGEDTEGALQALAEDGACILADALSTELCDALLASLKDHVDAMPWGVDELGYRSDFYGRHTKRVHGLFSKAPRMAEVLTEPNFLSIARKRLVEGGVGDDIRLSNAELMWLGSGQANQVLHNDDASWRQVRGLMSGEVLVSVNCALTDFTADNGATRVVPGSHLWPARREPRPEEICLAEMSKGSALLYTGRVLHSGGENRTDDYRVGLYLGYVVSWLRPIENHLVTNNPEDIAALSEEARRLLDVVEGGFTVYA